MCRINISHTIRHRITTESLFRRLGIMDLDSYYHTESSVVLATSRACP